MNTGNTVYPEEKTQLYRLLRTQLLGLTDGVPHMLANFANAAALLYQGLRDINWAGFYFRKDDRLVLGPFQGKPACVEIGLGNGVCGTAAARDAVMLVPNVHEFPGHIACDAASSSEIVIPIHRDGAVIGVLDIDSPTVGRFDAADREGLMGIVRVLEGMWGE